jgi:hypothetical protein
MKNYQKKKKSLLKIEGGMALISGINGLRKRMILNMGMNHLDNQTHKNVRRRYKMARTYKITCYGIDKENCKALNTPVHAIVTVKNGELNDVKCPLRLRLFAKNGNCWFIGCNTKNKKTDNAYDNVLGLEKCIYF